MGQYIEFEHDIFIQNYCTSKQTQLHKKEEKKKTWKQEFCLVLTSTVIVI